MVLFLLWAWVGCLRLGSALAHGVDSGLNGIFHGLCLLRRLVHWCFCPFICCSFVVVWLSILQSINLLLVSLALPLRCSGDAWFWRYRTIIRLGLLSSLAILDHFIALLNFRLFFGVLLLLLPSGNSLAGLTDWGASLTTLKGGIFLTIVLPSECLTNGSCLLLSNFNSVCSKIVHISNKYFSEIFNSFLFIYFLLFGLYTN